MKVTSGAITESRSVDTWAPRMSRQPKPSLRVPQARHRPPSAALAAWLPRHRLAAISCACFSRFRPPAQSTSCRRARRAAVALPPAALAQSVELLVAAEGDHLQPSPWAWPLQLCLVRFRCGLFAFDARPLCVLVRYRLGRSPLRRYGCSTTAASARGSCFPTTACGPRGFGLGRCSTTAWASRPRRYVLLNYRRGPRGASAISNRASRASCSAVLERPSVRPLPPHAARERTKPSTNIRRAIRTSLCAKLHRVSAKLPSTG